MKNLKMFFTALMILVASAAYAQNITIHGVVKEASGEPIIGASVVQEGTLNGFVTDLEGAYRLTVPSNASITVSSIGYKSVTVAVGGRTSIDVVLEPDSELLDETIVVAFGTATKESFTGSAAVVNDARLSKSQTSSVTNALSGAVAGVQLTSSNGAPGSTSTIRVRGFSSISAGQSPLIIVDGAPYAGDIANINQADVESMTVLKDAASNALYGARGANGVIIITTKNAKKGQATVTFDAKIGGNTKALREYNVITDPAMFYEDHYQAVKRYYMAGGLSEEQAHIRTNMNIEGDSASGGLGYQIWTYPQGQMLIGSNGKLNPNATLGKVVGDFYVTPDNWSDYGYRTGLRQEYNFSVSAAQDKASFYASMSYLGNQGITFNSDFDRFSARLRADYQAKPWLKVGGNFSYAKYNANTLSNNGTSTSSGNVWAFTSQMAPIYPIYVRNADGSIMVDANGYKVMDYGDGKLAGFGRPFIQDANPIMDNLLNTNNTEGNQMTANGFADFTILPGLKLTINGTAYLDEYRYTWIGNGFYGQFDSTGGTVSKEHDRSWSVNTQQLLNYNFSVGQNNIGLLLGHEFTDDYGYGLWASKNKMFSPDNKELSGAVIDGQSAGSSISEYNNEGFFFRGQYDYDSRIFASASLRRDASSRFAPENRWGTFWSLGGAWIMSKERWFNVPAVNEFKLKASVGSQGNDNIGSYRYTDLYDIINSDGSVATQFDSKGNHGITWETNTNMNIGTEFALYNRVTGSLEYFNRVTSDMLFSFPVAPSMGYSSYWANVGNMRNYGLELELNANLVNTSSVKWDIYGNLTYLKNRVTKLHEDKKTTSVYDAAGNEYKGYSSGSFFITEGSSLYTWYLKEFAGVDQETGESLWYKDVKDENGDRTGERETTKKFADATYYMSGKTTIAPVYGGFGTTVDFFGFDFSINFSYQLGGTGYDSTYANFMQSPTSNSIGYNVHVDRMKAWTKENPSADIPRAQFGDLYTSAASTRFMTSARYLNIENINFGYTLPSSLTRRAGIESVRIYCAAENVWYWSARQGFDPRQTYSGSSNATNYSPMRTISGGVSLKF